MCSVWLRRTEIRTGVPYTTPYRVDATVIVADGAQRTARLNGLGAISTGAGS